MLRSPYSTRRSSRKLITRRAASRSPSGTVHERPNHGIEKPVSLIRAMDPNGGGAVRAWHPADRPSRPETNGHAPWRSPTSVAGPAAGYTLWGNVPGSHLLPKWTIRGRMRTAFSQLRGRLSWSNQCVRGSCTTWLSNMPVAAWVPLGEGQQLRERSRSASSWTSRSASLGDLEAHHSQDQPERADGGNQPSQPQGA
jgi:hypothetical protein